MTSADVARLPASPTSAGHSASLPASSPDHHHHHHRHRRMLRQVVCAVGCAALCLSLKLPPQYLAVLKQHPELNRYVLRHFARTQQRRAARDADDFDPWAGIDFVTIKAKAKIDKSKFALSMLADEKVRERVFNALYNRFKDNPIEIIRHIESPILRLQPAAVDVAFARDPAESQAVEGEAAPQTPPPPPPPVYAPIEYWYPYYYYLSDYNGLMSGPSTVFWPYAE